MGPLCNRRYRTVRDNGHTHLTGEESQICLFGGCLLITYVPCWPRSRVMTPLYGTGTINETEAQGTQCARKERPTLYSTSSEESPCESKTPCNLSSNSSIAASASASYSDCWRTLFCQKHGNSVLHRSSRMCNSKERAMPTSVPLEEPE